ncbi:Hypothetical predicted protein [Pelobates cultripes]|uniref:Uncharacterized protein n=1 Tax=Pelobates cultripes TaxID=61616 RepID=A0AAD1THD2_PELCU|nr:Hypothetical predicted protein [Pelobates cultripes]
MLADKQSSLVRLRNTLRNPEERSEAEASDISLKISNFSFTYCYKQLIQEQCSNCEKRLSLQGKVPRVYRFTSKEFKSYFVPCRITLNKDAGKSLHQWHSSNARTKERIDKLSWFDSHVPENTHHVLTSQGISLIDHFIYLWGEHGLCIPSHCRCP